MRIALAALLVTASLVAQEAPAPTWFKGNTHTHTLNSDGDSTPDEVVRWYREHNYHFLVLTDHNFLTSVDGLNALHGAEGKFLVIPGEEVSDRFGEKQIHVNGLNLKRLVKPQGGETVAEVVQRNVDAIRAESAVPHINHPNFGWAITAEDLKKIRNDKLLEIFNGHPLVNNRGGADAPGMEEVWDILLTAGKVIYGIAVDDAHHFKRPWDAWASKPGQGWVVVRSRALDAASILSAMEAGDFYASTGVELTDLTVDDKQIVVSIRQASDAKFSTEFIGSGGTVLLKTGANPAIYRRRGDEPYVRAKVTDSNGHVAWIQPVFAKGR